MWCFVEKLRGIDIVTSPRGDYNNNNNNISYNRHHMT